jgi:ABC-type spermidine/putrescine transport system permease subunit II
VALPGVILGVSLAISFRAFGIPPGLVRAGPPPCHAVVMLVVLARLRRLDRPARAPMDLGQPPAHLRTSSSR